MFNNLMVISMRTLKLLAGAIAIVAFASCSNDTVVSNVETAQVAKQSIGFSPLTKGATRGVVNAAADLGDFAVTAYVNTPAAAGATDYYFGTSTPTNKTLTAGTVYESMENIKIQYNAGGWDYANAADLKYWPYIKKADGTYESTTTLDFEAISPASIGATAAADGKFTSAYGGGSIQKYTVGTDDVCYAKTTGKQQSDGAVPMQFKHLLSQVVFAAKQASGLTVEITEIKLAKVPNQAAWSAATDAWTVDGASTTADYAGVSGAVTVTASGDAATPQVLTAAGSEILLIPQDASALTYDPTKIGKTVAGNAKGTETTGDPLVAVEDLGVADAHWKTDNTYQASDKLFLKVTLSIKGSDGSYSIGSATTYESIYFAVKTNWEAGKKYTYTLLFGGVKGPDGSAATSADIAGGTYNDGQAVFTSTPITFTADVTDWVDADSQLAF